MELAIDLFNNFFHHSSVFGQVIDEVHWERDWSFHFFRMLAAPWLGVSGSVLVFVLGPAPVFVGVFFDSYVA